MIRKTRHSWVWNNSLRDHYCENCMVVRSLCGTIYCEDAENA